MREDSCLDPYLRHGPIELMPGAREALEVISIPKGVWANTSAATASDVRRWLERAALDHLVSWIVASAEIGSRKPELEFFAKALAACQLEPNEVAFVGNQLDTDITGANLAGIRCVYLAGKAYRSVDARDAPGAKPSFTIETLFELPGLVAKLLL